MFSLVYIEEALLQHPRVELLTATARAPLVTCERYTQVFNRKAQNFRLQKHRPALILAKKHDGLVLPAPLGYGIGGKHNYYFSHMLNCLYDCRYCFLQGMYRSAHYVLFVNYEDFMQQMEQVLAQHPGQQVYFFSGYDCDSLAMEPVTEFAAGFLPWFERHPQAVLELRTKSTQIRGLMQRPALDNVVVAFSFTPAGVSGELEHKVPALEKRIQAMAKLQRLGWPIGLRLDPVIYCEDYKAQYRQLLERIFSVIDPAALHSVSLGGFRMPVPYFDNMKKLYPHEVLFAGKLQRSGKMYMYEQALEEQMLTYCEQLLMQYIDKNIFYPCVL